MPITINTDAIITKKPSVKNIIVKKLLPLLSSNAQEQQTKNKKNDGDLFQYKNFESSDDIRRIIWKVYAKNEELIVRTPDKEYENTYETQITINRFCTNNIAAETKNYILDEIKFATKTILNSYQKNNTLYLTDHILNYQIAHDENALDNYILNLKLDNNINPKQYFNPKLDNIHILHSGIDSQNIENILSAASKNTIFYFIPLTQIFSSYNNYLPWLKKLLFISSEKDIHIQIKNKSINSRVLQQWKDVEKLVEAYIPKSNSKILIWSPDKS